MAWNDAFAPVEEEYYKAILRDTWGHLAPKKGKSYAGRIVFSFGVYESGDINPTVLVSDFSDDLDGGPWFYDAIHEFLHRFTPGEPGRVYEWVGTFRNYKFKGKKPRLILNANEAPAAREGKL